MISEKKLLFPKLSEVASQLEFNGITLERKQILHPLVDYIQNKVAENRPIRLNFICTHNSRRSHLSQVWAQTAAAFYGIQNVTCYSGGTEATALFPVVAKTLEDVGFEIVMLSKGENPVYAIKYSENEPPIIGFSKTYDTVFNPSGEFAAIMTCSQADEGCPFIAGAEKRIPITYKDPKAFDNTPIQKEKYSERNIQIATEMFYVFSKISH